VSELQTSAEGEMPVISDPPPETAGGRACAR
jgi:hypothetical protein